MGDAQQSFCEGLGLVRASDQTELGNPRRCFVLVFVLGRISTRGMRPAVFCTQVEVREHFLGINFVGYAGQLFFFLYFGLSSGNIFLSLLLLLFAW